MQEVPLVCVIPIYLALSVIISIVVRELIFKTLKNITETQAVFLVFCIWMPGINVVFLIIFLVLWEIDSLTSHGKRKKQ